MPTTGKDETKDGKLLARQNVVHEAGLFQGKLGFTRAIILLEEVTEEFSNLAGLKRKRAYGSGRTQGWFTATANNRPARSLNLVSKSIPRP
jgi:Predicted nucleotide-binding protein containing TIR-like domain